MLSFAVTGFLEWYIFHLESMRDIVCHQLIPPQSSDCHVVSQHASHLTQDVARGCKTNISSFAPGKWHTDDNYVMIICKKTKCQRWCTFFNQVFNANGLLKCWSQQAGCLFADVNIWFSLNSLSLFWPIGTRLDVWVACIKRQLRIATQVFSLAYWCQTWFVGSLYQAAAWDCYRGFWSRSRSLLLK